LQFWVFFCQNSPLDRANLQTNPTINAGGKVDVIPIGTFDVFARAGLNTSHRASINTVGNAFTGIGDNGVGHSKSSAVMLFYFAINLGALV
jgi:hypothetical protein